MADTKIPDEHIFRNWLRRARLPDTPELDFRNDALGDKRFPDPSSWDELEGYLASRHACHQAVTAGEKVWKRYVRWLKRQASS